MESGVTWSGWGMKMKHTKILKRAEQERRVCFSRDRPCGNVRFDYSVLCASSASHCISRPLLRLPSSEASGWVSLPVSSSAFRVTWPLVDLPTPEVAFLSAVEKPAPSFGQCSSSRAVGTEATSPLHGHGHWPGQCRGHLLPCSAPLAAGPPPPSSIA